MARVVVEVAVMPEAAQSWTAGIATQTQAVLCPVVARVVLLVWAGGDGPVEKHGQRTGHGPAAASALGPKIRRQPEFGAPRCTGHTGSG